MIFERFVDPGLAQHSFVVGCEGTREIMVVDPRRDIDVYLGFAREKGYRIAHVMDTHIHADFASGAKELAEVSGAKLHLSGYDDGEVFEVAYPHNELREGDAITVGGVRIEVLHTPGHTPEHLSFLLFEEARSKDLPIAMLTGDFLFVGSLGRPDLLGDDAKEALARQMFASVRDKLSGLPDGLEVHPGHGAGSACGKGMSGRPVSTLGYERATNSFLNPELSEDDFIKQLLEGQPDIPDFYPRNKRINSEGPRAVLDLPGANVPLAPGDVAKRAAAGEVVVIDLRDPLAFGGGHLPKALGIGLGPLFATWAGWVAPKDKPLVLIDADGDRSRIEQAVRYMVRTGVDHIEGYVEGGMQACSAAGLALETLPQLSPAAAREALDAGKINLVDARASAEFAEGHVETAINVPVQAARDRVPGLDFDAPIAVMCGSGYRSTVAASLLKAQGYRRIQNVNGGLMAWNTAGISTRAPEKSA
ncbi:MAG: MBL fold metallo-hydrolase [Thioalkalivibrionaceae bacterium]